MNDAVIMKRHTIITTGYSQIQYRRKGGTIPREDKKVSKSLNSAGTRDSQGSNIVQILVYIWGSADMDRTGPVLPPASKLIYSRGGGHSTRLLLG